VAVKLLMERLSELKNVSCASVNQKYAALNFENKTKQDVEAVKNKLTILDYWSYGEKK